MRNRLYHILGLLLLCVSATGGVLDVGQNQDFGSLKQALFSARPWDTLYVHQGVYKEGTIVIDKPLVIIGVNQPVLDGENEYGILRVESDSVVIKGLTLKDVGISYVEDKSAIRIVRSKHCTIEANQLINAFFGIYLERSSDCMIIDNHILGFAEHEMNSGNAIHLWYSNRNLIDGNHAEGHRDGIYLEFVDNSVVKNNLVENNLRYGLHFMFSDNDRYQENTFVSNGAGVAVMFSKNITMEGNKFLDNWGGSSYGLLLKDITDSEIRNNLFSKNTTGIYGEGAIRIQITGNDFVRNGWALNILGSCNDNTIINNNFVNNTFEVATNSKRNYNSYDGNYWSENRGSYDLDLDGISDVPYRPVKLFSFMMANMESTSILMRSLLVDLINHAETVAPVITPHNLMDSKPLMNRVEHD
ncbi:MAG: nitrous oxide reductase family maturation protein NosD [Bacteroidetes bacterium]|nr:nitrous oxide reductase family maturation protein NosD [Bacteroidota bacterium]